MPDLVPPAGFEPASTGLKDRGPVPLDEGGDVWSGQRKSNPRPTVWKTAALPLSYTRMRFGGECRSRTCPTFRSRRVSTAMPCRSANSPEPWQDSVVRGLLIADIVFALATVEAAGAQAAFFETGVPSHMDTSRCARASRSTPCRHARRGRRAAPASRRDNPRLRLREGSKGRQSVEVVASHCGLLWFDFRQSGQGGRIRTYDLLVPSQERCQAAPRPESGPSSRTRTCDLPVRNRVLCSN
jgi:hypothetical protein